MLLRRRAQLPLGILLLGIWLAWPVAALGARATTADALARLEEIVAARLRAGAIHRAAVLPTLLVSTRPRYEASEGWFEVQAVSTLARIFGGAGVRLCEGCMVPRVEAAHGRLDYSSGPLTLAEIAAFDDRYRGDSARARTATWIDETATGVAVKMVDLATGQIVFAQNVDPLLLDTGSSSRTFTLAEELERRQRGESLTHAMVDMGMYPGQHFSLEWADQWGDTNANLTGFALSFYDPILGVGASHHRVLSWLNTSIGAKVFMSIPTAVVGSQIDDGDTEILDPLITGVFVVRVPFGRSNYAALLTASTNGEVALGITLLNTSFLPLLP